VTMIRGGGLARPHVDLHAAHRIDGNLGRRPRRSVIVGVGLGVGFVHGSQVRWLMGLWLSLSDIACLAVRQPLYQIPHWGISYLIPHHGMVKR
jgi:hypothetical protein